MSEQVQTNCSKKLVVLIAEDDKASSLLMRLGLKRAGILNKIINFENGKELLDFLYSRVEVGDSIEKTYVLILDIYMPKVNGIEVLTSIREHSNLSGIPVIVNSSCDDQETINLCYSLGCIDYKVKPVKADDIILAFENIGLAFSKSSCFAGQYNG